VNLRYHVNGAYRWLLDCDLKCPVIMEILSCVYDIYHMYILATYLEELMTIMVVCADQKDGILYAAFMDTVSLVPISSIQNAIFHILKFSEIRRVPHI